MPPELGKWLFNESAQRVEPFKVFDNVYFVGICWVSSWLLTTPQGHILIDTLHEPFPGTVLDGIRKLGFDPQDVRWVLVTHGHFDHVGGAFRLKSELKNARFAMTEKSWNVRRSRIRWATAGLEKRISHAATRPLPSAVFSRF